MSESALLTPDELDRRLADLLRARAARRAPHVGPAEADLLARINAGPDPDTWTEYRRLRAARDAGTLTTADHQELIRLSDRIEEYEADRAAALAELAAVRGQTLGELADALALGPPAE